MPLIPKSAYPGPPWYQYNGHWQTILPTTIRRVRGLQYERERLELADGDFLDLDWVNNQSQDLLILTHGLEGNSDRIYMKGMAKFFADQHWDVLAWNCRSCSEEMNRAFRLYYHGEIEDIATVIDHALNTRNYQRIVLVGFSMGGNITLKYLGVNGSNIPKQITHGLAFSTPCDLAESIKELEKPKNKFYNRLFFKRLEAKIRAKAAQFPDRLDLSKFAEIKVWRDFDTYFSAPLTGLSSADEFYFEASSRNFMAGTTIPTLIVNAQNDPLLNDSSSPKDISENHPYLYLETPKKGGHVGFGMGNRSHVWAELRAWEFCHQ